MTDQNDERSRPTTNQPLNADKPRPRVTPILAVVGLIVVIAVVFLLITWVQQNT